MATYLLCYGREETDKSKLPVKQKREVQICMTNWLVLQVTFHKGWNKINIKIYNIFL